MTVLSRNSETPLMYAVLGKQHEAAEYLIKNGVNIDAVSGHEDQIDTTSLHLAAQNGDDAMVDLLIRMGSKVAGVNRSTSAIMGITPLHDGAESGNRKCIQVRTVILEYHYIIKLGKLCLNTFLMS